jgi:hypothetical protein
VTAKTDLKKRAQVVLAEVASLNIDDTAGLEIYVRSARRKDGEDGWFVLNLDETAQEKLIGDCANFVAECVSRDLVPFLEDSATQNDVSFIHEDDFADLGDVLQEAKAGAGAATFDKDVETTKLRLRSSYITFPRSKEELVLVGPADVQLVGTASKAFFEIGPKDKLKLHKGKLVQIGHTYTFLKYKEFYFVSDEAKFENLTGFNQMIEKRAEKAVEALTNIGGVEFVDASAVKDASRFKEFARKLAAALSMGVFKRLTKETIKKDILHNKVGIKYAEKDGKLMLDPDLSDREGRRDFIDLLVENFYTSAAGQRYRAVKKSPRN